MVEKRKNDGEKKKPEKETTTHSPSSTAVWQLQHLDIWGCFALL
jgi:hypothetical protein